MIPSLLEPWLSCLGLLHSLFLFAAEAGTSHSISWHLLPMALVISLVYSASRFELPEVIVRRALRLFTTIMIFMGGVFLLLWLLSSPL